MDTEFIYDPEDIDLSGVFESEDVVLEPMPPTVEEYELIVPLLLKMLGEKSQPKPRHKSSKQACKTLWTERISIRLPHHLLMALKTQAAIDGVGYQVVIKRILTDHFRCVAGDTP